MMLFVMLLPCGCYATVVALACCCSRGKAVGAMTERRDQKETTIN